MARSLDQISAELAQLDTATEELDAALQAVYQDYLTVLGQAVKRQLILAAYHLCTQTYPDEFLTLSRSHRESLQAKLRAIANQGQSQINQLVHMADLNNLAAQLEEAVVARYNALAMDDEAIADLSSEAVARVEKHQTLESDENVDVDVSLPASPPWPLPSPEPTVKAEVEANAASEDKTETETIAESEDSPEAEDTVGEAAEKASALLQRLSTSLSLFSVLGAEPLTPMSLAKRHVLWERHLRAILRTLSSVTNHLLKQADILPDLPEMVIAAATEAEGGETGPSMPNLVSVLVEMTDRHDDDDDDEPDPDEEEMDEDEFEEADADSAMTHLVALNLRLADIEFADHRTALWRGRLQEQLLKLKRLGSRYQKLQQEKARAEAEHAWRAIWFEE